MEAVLYGKEYVNAVNDAQGIVAGKKDYDVLLQEEAEENVEEDSLEEYEEYEDYSESFSETAEKFETDEMDEAVEEEEKADYPKDKKKDLVEQQDALTQDFDLEDFEKSFFED